jgi:two-component system OmpR family sensor kinase
MLRQLSLRTRLVLGVLVLAAAGLVAADAVTYTSLGSFLVQRVDRTLESDHQAFDRADAVDDGPSSPHGPGGGPGPGGGQAASDLFVQYRTLHGKTVLSTRNGGGPSGTTAPQLPGTISMTGASMEGNDRVRYFTVGSTAGGGGRYRVRASFEPGIDTMLVLALSLHDVDGTLHRLLVIELLVTAVVLLVLAGAGFWVVGLGLRPLRAIEKTAGAIASGDLSRRVERAEERTEVGRLGLALNTMLSQIEAAFKAREASERKLRRFVADASHELRTPLAAVRAYAELFTRGADRRPDDLARAMTGITRESERMSLLVQDLLLLARLDEGRPLERKPVQLDDVVAEAVETARMVEPRRPVELDSESVVVLGDRDRLRQIVDNLLSNVRAHTPSAAPVRVLVGRANGDAVIDVEDNGPGLTDRQLERVFERFYRADQSRARASGGVGLGLSIVAAVAEAHGGCVTARSRQGTGATFRIALPLLPEGNNSHGTPRAFSGAAASMDPTSTKGGV